MVAGDDGPLGRPGTDCVPGTPGNENISEMAGKDGPAFSGAVFCKSRKSAEKPGVCGDEAEETPGANDGASVSEAGIARRSPSVNGVGGIADGNAGMPGTGWAPGTPGNENASFNDGNEGVALSGEVLSRE